MIKVVYVIYIMSVIILIIWIWSETCKLLDSKKIQQPVVDTESLTAYIHAQKPSCENYTAQYHVDINLHDNKAWVYNETQDSLLFTCPVDSLNQYLISDNL